MHLLIQKFEPSGKTLIKNDRILSATSILDYVFRELAISYLGKEELAHTPSISNKSDTTQNSENEKFLKIVKTLLQKALLEAQEEKLVDLSDIRLIENLKISYF